MKPAALIALSTTLAVAPICGIGYLLWRQTPQGMRYVCGRSASPKAIEESLRKKFEGPDGRTARLIYDRNFENYKADRRITWAEYYEREFGPIAKVREKEAREMEAFIEASKAGKRGVKLYPHIPDERLDEETTMGAPQLPPYNLPQLRNSAYQDCLREQDPGIISQSDKRRFLDD
jgi:hypothetical protein